MLTLICGHPNSGKTTFSSRFENVLHLDDFPRNKFLNCNRAVAESDCDVVIEGIYNLKCRRMKLLEGYKGKKVCYWLDAPYEVCVRREQEGRQRKGVMENSYVEPPTIDEGWDEIIIIGGTDESISDKSKIRCTSECYIQ